MHLSRKKIFEFLVYEGPYRQICEQQKKFLKLIQENGVRLYLTEEDRKNPRFQVLVDLLCKMHEDGIIPALRIIHT